MGSSKDRKKISNEANLAHAIEARDEIADLRPLNEDLNSEEWNDGATRPYDDPVIES